MKKETFWLIEKKVSGCPVWLSDDKCFGWTTNAVSAFRYESEEDALTAMRELKDVNDWFVTEHSIIGENQSSEAKACGNCGLREGHAEYCAFNPREGR